MMNRVPRSALYTSAAVATLVLIVVWISSSLTDRRERSEIASLQESVMTDWMRATRMRKENLENLVPSLERALEQARKANANLLLTSRVQTETVRFVFGESSSATPSVEAGTKKVSPTPSSSRKFEVNVSADVQTAVAGLADGRIEWTSRIFATMTYDGQTQTKELPTRVSTVGTNPDLEKAWRSWLDRPPRVAVIPRSFRHLRAGWSVGPGGGVTISGSPAIGVFVVWGPQL